MTAIFNVLDDRCTVSAAREDHPRSIGIQYPATKKGDLESRRRFRELEIENYDQYV